MNASDIKEAIAALGQVSMVEADGNYFFSCKDDEAAQAAHWRPFATLMTNDAYDQHSDLNRAGVYRLNIGISRAAFQRLLGSGSEASAHLEPASGSIDYTAVDRIMPHPVYADQHWISVLSPSLNTFETVRPLLIEALSRAQNRQRLREQHQRD